jgi:predicted molibdopterin-dependent oxidoreductase YjgC
MQTTRIFGGRGDPLSVTVNGQLIEAYAGETIATVLLASGHLVFQQEGVAHQPRSIFCGMGVCFNCLVTVSGIPNLRACVTPVAAGMTITTLGEPRD